MSFVEDIKILIVKKGISMSELARRLGESPQNYGLKLKRNSIRDKDLKQAALALGCAVEVYYKDLGTGEVIYKSEI